MVTAVVKDNCRAAPQGHTVVEYVEGQVVEGDEAEFLLKAKLAKKGKAEPQTKKAEAPAEESVEESDETES